MRIVTICEFFPTNKELKFSGGVESRTYFVFKNLAKKNDVHVITTRLPNTKELETLNGIKIHRVGPTKNYRASAALSQPISVVKFISAAILKGASLKPQIVEGTNFVTHYIAKQISNKNKIPVVFWYPDVFLGDWFKTTGLITAIIGSTLERLNLWQSADKYIAISNCTKQKLEKHNIEKNKISVISCGVEKKEFALKVSKFKDPTIICVSRLVAYKRIADLVWAFAKVKKNIPKLKLIIVGRGPLENGLKNIVRITKNQTSVTFLNNLKRTEIVRLIKSSHVSCLPSETEGFGIFLIESAVAQVPYVCSDIKVFKEITKNNLGGFAFKTGSILDLSNKLEELLKDDVLYKKKSQQCLELSEFYDWQKISLQTQALYKSLLGK